MPTLQLTAEQLAQALDTLNKTKGGWSLQDDKLSKQYKFSDFQHAFGFMTICALYYEKVNQHPEWSNVYNRVTVQLTTHDAAGISDKDVALAQQMDDIFTMLAH